MRKEFAFHKLNQQGQTKAELIGDIFEEALSRIESYVPDSRELAIVRTKLEEACFFAKKGMAAQASNQEAKSAP